MPSPLASVKNPTPYWTKHEKLDLDNLTWNIPEQPSGSVLLIGGNAASFALPIRIGEFLASSYPLAHLELLFPDVLASKLPKDPRFVFAASTPSGSLADSPIIAESISHADATLILGDLSKNPQTADALVKAVGRDGTAGRATEGERRSGSAQCPDGNPPCGAALSRPLLLTRDSVDLLAPSLISHPRLILIASMPQLQKLFRTLYYPKVLLLSMPILPVVEALHKFTISYPTEIITFHGGFILAAKNGAVHSLPITATDYTPLSLWQGQLAARYLALTLYNLDIFSKL